MKNLIKTISICFLTVFLFVSCKSTNKNNIKYEVDNFGMEAALELSRDIWFHLDVFYNEVNVFDNTDLNNKIKNKNDFKKLLKDSRIDGNILDDLYSLLFEKTQDGTLIYRGDDTFPNVYNKDIYIDKAYVTTISYEDSMLKPEQILTVELKSHSPNKKNFKRNESYKLTDTNRWSLYSLDGINGFFNNKTI